MDKTQKQVWKTIQEMNRKWTVENDADALKNYFHKGMVAVVPSEGKRIEGRKKCVAGWKNFSENANIRFFKETEPKIQVYGEGKFAVVTYYFDMSFEIGKQTIRMKGRDMFSLINKNGKWLVVADQYSSFPTQ